MRTEHVLRLDDAARMPWDDGSVDLVVTSPPYPMIAMWDDLFGSRDVGTRAALRAGDGWEAFERMHAQLDVVWDEVVRLLSPGGVVAVNVGDATRTLDDEFRRYPNHSRVIQAFEDRGLTPLPDVLWRKPTNRLTKFMGSGMLPPNAYVTLEHEYVLLFRKGGPRSFDPGDQRRYESAFFWEERNQWFSDLWTLTGAGQAMDGDGDSRDRSGAFPVEVPLRLVRMFSVYGDTVLDPFAGTGTTTLAAMHAGRNSLSVELDPDLVSGFADRLDGLPERSRRRCHDRLDRHRAFVADREETPSYDAAHYDFPVVTRQERDIRLYAVDEVSPTTSATDPDGSRRYEVDHAPV
jgi:site-specific DNA-methyltransferase (adenine-specific)